MCYFSNNVFALMLMSQTGENINAMFMIFYMFCDGV